MDQEVISQTSESPLGQTLLNVRPSPQLCLSFLLITSSFFTFLVPHTIRNDLSVSNAYVWRIRPVALNVFVVVLAPFNSTVRTLILDMCDGV